MAFVADDDDGTRFEKRIKECRAESDGRVLQDEDTDVLTGKCPLAFVKMDDELFLAKGESSGALGDFEGVFDHLAEGIP